ncbi:MAG: 50S ribosomal protein L30 [Chloroflexi bacterium]|nr:50S ribosomal protein L30 [Chloroflexota bacterium]
MAKLQIKWVKSTIGFNRDQRKVIRALGLHRLNQTVTHEDSRSIRGMVTRVRHLLQVEEQNR